MLRVAMVGVQCLLVVDASVGGRAREGGLLGVVGGGLVWIPVMQKSEMVSIHGIRRGVVAKLSIRSECGR